MLGLGIGMGAPFRKLPQPINPRNKKRQHGASHSYSLSHSHTQSATPITGSGGNGSNTNPNQLQQQRMRPNKYDGKLFKILFDSLCFRLQDEHGREIEETHNLCLDRLVIDFSQHKQEQFPAPMLASTVNVKFLVHLFFFLFFLFLYAFFCVLFFA